MFEVRFPGELSLLSNLSRIQAALRDDFPTLLVPNVGAGEAPALKPYRFASSDGTELVHVGLSLFSYITRRYIVYSDFKARFVELFRVFMSACKPRHLTRVGLRYLNLLPAQAGSPDQVHPWLRLGVNLPTSFGGALSQLRGTILLAKPEASLRITCGNAEAQKDVRALSLGNFLLDFDCYREGEIAVSEAPRFLDSAHRIIDDAFYDILTDDALNLLKGSP